MVYFQYHNLVANPFPSLLNNLSAFDLILCRNVMIYFSRDILCQLVGQFHQTLVNGGWLAVGHAELDTQLYRSFRTVNTAGAVLYQKESGPSQVPWEMPAPVLPAVRLPSGNEAEGLVSPSPQDQQKPGFFQKPGFSSPSPPPNAVDLAAIRSFADQGAWDQAAHSCEKLLKEDRLNPRVHFYHALVLEQMGLHDRAEEALRRTLYLDRHFVQAHYYLGLLLQRLGQVPGAMRSFQNVLRLLSRMDAVHVFPDGDGLTAGDLAKLTRQHLEVLEGI